jgi:putative addiction module component (TIGR02574 family)
MSLNQIKDAVAELPDKERGALAAWLLDSLPPNNGEDASAEGIAEADRRREELDSGRVKPVSADEFWASVERERSSWK